MIGALVAASILIIVATTTVVETAVDKSSSNFGLLSTSPNKDAGSRGLSGDWTML